MKKSCLFQLSLFLLFMCIGPYSYSGTHWNWGFGVGGGNFGPGWPGYYGPSSYWGGPNVIIASPPPPPRYIVRECETVEVCDEFDECWLERYCN